MSIPPAVQAIWEHLESARDDVLRATGALTQAQSEWHEGDGEWSIGEILHHLIVAETQTGKLTTKLVREAEAAGTLLPYPADLATLEPLPPRSPHGMQAPAAVLPEAGRSLPGLLEDLRTVRGRSRQSIERIARIDPRPLTFKHFALGELNLAQWWMLQAAHDRIHLGQIQAIGAAPAFPR